MHRLAPILLIALALVSAACGGRARVDARSPPPSATTEAGARAALARFAAAVEDGRWAEAHALLSARWREVYTPERLALDFEGAGAAALETARRVTSRIAAGDAPQVEGGRAVLPLGPDRAAVLAFEDDGWRVDALE